MTRTTHARRGATLLEVLIGFGILGIAVTSLITLPIFASLTVSTALKDDRTTTAATAGDSLISDEHRKYVVEPGPYRTLEPYYWAMDNPAAYGASSSLPALSSTTEIGPSYAVYADPMGVVARPISGVLMYGASVGNAGLIPRVQLQSLYDQSNLTGQPIGLLSLRACSLLDGLTYDDTGNVPGGADMRELRYNFAWMLQRRSNRDRMTVRQQVVVYDRRIHLYAPASSEFACTATMYPGETRIDSIPGSAEIRRGTWILDTGAPASGLRQAEFYRVVSVTEIPIGGGATTFTVEVHKPVVRSDGQTASYTGALTVIPAIADVFERPALTAGMNP
jgi:hypothetical protein